ncbi:MAG: bifunctional metallophosphatase/5'-nucleotidase [Butyrivibrio sp.]|jgi:2',3'-cyclic-nucleotide 2'-phosphodiesterase/3'-nucleotidase|nr:bifunctional metallophosphatase/5'-nucleotidase [Butyrivibrio sp.]
MDNNLRTLNIIYTSDTHGHVYPIDYAKNAPCNASLLNIATEYTKDGNTLVLDGGDSLQGTPLTQYYLANADKYPYHPIAEAFNAMGLDFYTLGNHDFNFGYEAIRDYIKAMNARCLCANVEDLGGELKLEKTAIVTLENGLRVGLSGVVTDWVNVWEQEDNIAKTKVTDPFVAAKKALEEIKDKCDITVLIYHGGLEENPATGQKMSDTTENIGCKIAHEQDWDILLTGHQHIANEKFVIDGTFAVQPPAKAEKYIVMQAVKSEDDLKITSKLVSTGDVHEEVVYNKMLPLEKDVQSWLDIPIGSLKEPIIPEEKIDAALNGSRLAAIFNQTQLEWSGADFSCTSLGNDPLGLEKDITIRDVCAVYPFANTVFVVEVTKQTIKDSLERVASYFTLVDGKPQVSEEFLKPKVEHYNYDFYAGLDYEFDLRRPVGDRVVKMVMLDGSELSDSRTYTLVTSNYRATGTGGYKAIGESRVIRNSTEEMPDLLQDYIRKNSPVGDVNNFRIKVFY